MDVTSSLKAILLPEDWKQTTWEVTHASLGQNDFRALKLFLFNVSSNENNLCVKTNVFPRRDTKGEDWSK